MANLDLTSLQERVYPKSEVIIFTPDSLALSDDLTTLNTLNEAVILHNLRQRFFNDDIYV